MQEPSTSPTRASPWWDYPRFKGRYVRVLLVSMGHLLVPELKEGFQRAGHHCQILLIPGETATLGEIQLLLENALRAIKPDFLLTINHRGLDLEGYIARMLGVYRIPFASWYVDSPQLILGHYQENDSPFLTLFLWDRDYSRMFQDLGFQRVEYLPLGVDEKLFHPRARSAETGKIFPMPVSFVGNSMFYKAGLRLLKSGVMGPLKERFSEIAGAFMDSPHLVVRDFLQAHHPDLLPPFQALSEPQALAYETGITWHATGLYRLIRIRRLERFKATIAGDPGWFPLMNGNGFAVRRELNYYKDLPGFYASSALCFNATSRQMKQGVNQRVFDVPACRRVVLTDWTTQLPDLMEPGKELLAYQSPDEIPTLVEKALRDKPFADNIARAGYRRVLAQHTYAQRTACVVEKMREAYG